jgi:Flp pilus assembly pilin Flp
MAMNDIEISGSGGGRGLLALVAGFACSEAASTRLEYALIGSLLAILLIGLIGQAVDGRGGVWQLLRDMAASH